MKTTKWLSLVSLSALGGGALWLRRARARTESALQAQWADLRAVSVEGAFDPEMVADLPEPAQRYLLRAIAPGAPLVRSVELKMDGSIRLKPEGSLLPFQAEQVLHPPEGFIWKASAGAGLVRFSGFDRYVDGQGTMRWWLLGLIPIVYADGADVTRSAAGRMAIEACMAPAALLPQMGVTWEEVDETTARAHLQVGDETPALTLEVDAEGRLQRISMERWQGDPSFGAPGYKRFAVDQFAGERTYEGYTIPTRFRAGWRLGEPDEFSFFYGELTDVSFGP